MTSDRKIVYIAGKMRNCENFNFPAFDKAAELAKQLGFDEVINPAAMDRADNLEWKETLTKQQVQEMYAKRDCEAILRSTHVALLPGWEESFGARTECALAAWTYKTILDATDFTPYGEIEYIITRKKQQ